MEFREQALLVVTILFVCLPDFVLGSLGDKSYVFQKCVHSCNAIICSKVDTKIYSNQQSFVLRLLSWTCDDQCRYDCMWSTVDAFMRDGTPVPQFHGKWPFVRVLGMQEPASVLFSVLNGLGHLLIFQYRRKVSSSTPLYYVWHGYAMVSINAWIWSTIYHCRDMDFTEMMDYFFALSIVMYNLFALICRLVGTDILWKPVVAASVLLVFFCQHMYYMAYVKFDYGYNMKVNIAIGAVTAVGWLVWCWRARRKQRYAWRCALIILAINVSLSLELLDFPPVWWTFDAHALWHGCTVPLTVLWWKFIIDDALYLQDRALFKKLI